MNDSAIRLPPLLCGALIKAIYGAEWDADERGNPGTGSDVKWELEGLLFDAAAQDASWAIDETAGLVYGSRLAKSLEAMAAIEKRWGDDQQTAILRHDIIGILNWDIANHDLLAMLRAGEELTQ